jgi:hypothetical protein
MRTAAGRTVAVRAGLAAGGRTTSKPAARLTTVLTTERTAATAWAAAATVWAATVWATTV